MSKRCPIRRFTPTQTASWAYFWRSFWNFVATGILEKAIAPFSERHGWQVREQIHVIAELAHESKFVARGGVAVWYGSGFLGGAVGSELDPVLRDFAGTGSMMTFGQTDGWTRTHKSIGDSCNQFDYNATARMRFGLLVIAKKLGIASRQSAVADNVIGWSPDIVFGSRA